MVQIMFGYIVISVISAVAFGMEPMASSTECTPGKKETMYQCREELDSLVRDQLATLYDINELQPIDVLQNNTIKEYTLKATQRIVCDPANKEKYDCLVGNLGQCQSLLHDSDFNSTYFGSILSIKWEEISSSSLCEAVSIWLCETLGPKFRDCASGMYEGGILSINPIDKDFICQPTSVPDLSCVIGVVRQCPGKINDGSMQTNLRTILLRDRWGSFGDGNELCACYEGRDCWSSLQSALRPVVGSSASTVRATYERTLATGDTLCKNQRQILCAQPIVASCPLDVVSSDDKDDINSLYQTATKTCFVYNTGEYAQQKDCLLQRLTDEFHPCVRKLNLPATVTECSDLKAIYKCIVLALRDQCSGVFVGPMFELFRGDLHKVKDCEYASAGSTIAEKIYPLSLLYAFSTLVWCMFVR